MKGLTVVVGSFLLKGVLYLPKKNKKITHCSIQIEPNEGKIVSNYKLKIMFKPILMAATLLLAPLTFAQTEEEKPYIEVTGTAEKEIVPDEIYISVVLRERDEGKKSISIEDQERDLKKAVQELGIPMDQLTLSDTDADYVKVSWGKHDVLTSKQYILLVHNAETVGKVFEKLDALKIQDAYISRVSHSKLTEFKKEVRIDAIKAAKEKADYLLTAIGQQTGMPLIVRESDPYSYNSYANYTRLAANSYTVMAESDEVKLPEIQFKKIKLSSSIYVKFEIK